jgi:hypothetical protein
MSNWLDLAQSRQDPLLAFYWDIVIMSPGGKLPPEYVEAIQVPLPKYDSDMAVFQARKYYFAKFEEFGVISCRFYEDTDTQVTLWLRDWQQRIKDDSGNYEVPSQYKGTIHVTAKDPMDADTTNFTLYGVFPTQVPALAFDSTGQRLVLDVEFSVDSLLIE